jgi:hypothetical protein
MQPDGQCYGNISLNGSMLKKMLAQIDSIPSVAMKNSGWFNYSVMFMKNFIISTFKP